MFVGISALVPRLTNDSGAIALSVFLAIIPALIWLGFFYQQDRAEPEPKQLVIRVLMFGALAAIVMPFVDQAIGKTITQISSLFPRLILTILTVSLIQESLKVAIVRYVVLGTREFDYHQDGIIYGLASGLGFATILTLSFFLSTDGVNPLAGAIRAVDNALMHGTLGAVSGYYIGRVKLDGKKTGWLIQGLAGVTIVNGFYAIISDELSRRLTFNPWYGLGAAFLLAITVGAILFAFFRRAELRATGELKTVSVQAHARSKRMPWDIHARYDYVLFGSIILAVIIGWVTSLVMTARTVPYTDDNMGITFCYPAGWAVENTDPTSMTIRELTGAGTFKPTIAIAIQKARPGGALDFLVAQSVTEYSYQKSLYTESRRDDTVQVADHTGLQVEYLYATSTASGPVVIRGIATYVLDNTRLYAFRYEAETDTFQGSLNRYQQVLRTARFAAEQ